MREGVPVLKTAFDRLLQQLDPDRERAGEKYEKIRQKLLNLFRWRGCAFPEELVDRTMDRVARKVEEGAEIRDLCLFSHGTALNVLREHWREAQKHQVKSLDDLPPSRHAVGDPIEVKERERERLENEKRLECLDRCIQNLPAQQLLLITKYHQGEGSVRIAQRNDLAARLGIPLNALRIRACKIRKQLEACISQCMETQAKASVK